MAKLEHAEAAHGRRGSDSKIGKNAAMRWKQKKNGRATLTLKDYIFILCVLSTAHLLSSESSLPPLIPVVESCMFNRVIGVIENDAAQGTSLRGRLQGQE